MGLYRVISVVPNIVNPLWTMCVSGRTRNPSRPANSASKIARREAFVVGIFAMQGQGTYRGLVLVGVCPGSSFLPNAMRLARGLSTH